MREYSRVASRVVIYFAGESTRSIFCLPHFPLFLVVGDYFVNCSSLPHQPASLFLYPSVKFKRERRIILSEARRGEIQGGFGKEEEACTWVVTAPPPPTPPPPLAHYCLWGRRPLLQGISEVCSLGMGGWRGGSWTDLIGVVLTWLICLGNGYRKKVSIIMISRTGQTIAHFSPQSVNALRRYH